MDTDVVVAGAGPTGLMLACELALAGVNVRVVEQRLERQLNSRALTLHPRSLEILDLRGLTPRFLAAGRTVPGWHFAGLATPLDFARLDTRQAHTLFLAQARTEALLEERALELGVAVERGSELITAREGADGLVVGVRDGQGGERSVRCAYLVGCDGARSRVRSIAGIPFPGSEESLTGVLGDFLTVDTEALVAARAQGILVAPLDGGVTRLVYIDPERMRVSSREPVTVEEFRGALVRLCGSDLGIDEPVWMSRFGNATRVADRYRAGRVFLAGDAAHIHFPAAGQGLNTGLQDAMNLGWKLAGAVKGWAGDELLDTYDAERRPVGHSVAQDTEVQALLGELPLLEGRSGPAHSLRSLLDELLEIPEVNRKLARRVSALSTVYAASENEHPLVGHRMPDVEVRTGDVVSHVSGLLTDGRFLLLTREDSGVAPVPHAPAERVRVAPVRDWPDHPGLKGVAAVLVRPDGHVAWAERSDVPDAALTLAGS
ncbi:FAD-dependent monooxygenase [Streptomyces sp. NPDC058257]|uniref:FAD-dependent monooxygenase n=1 Tax=Streptomyces sp. NPDC058257 TaxID=3346409 RepID=UPI0036EF358E